LRFPYEVIHLRDLIKKLSGIAGAAFLFRRADESRALCDVNVKQYYRSAAFAAVPHTVHISYEHFDAGSDLTHDSLEQHVNKLVPKFEGLMNPGA